MEHKKYEVEIYNENGDVVEVKQRKDINKLKDLIHSVHIFAFNSNNELILSVIPQKKDQELKNIYKDKYGTTAATIVRKDETHSQAAPRLAKKELFLENGDLTFLGKNLETYPDGVKRFNSVYVLTGFDTFENFNKDDIKDLIPMTRESLADLMEHKNSFADSFLVNFNRYSDKFPF